MRTGGGVVVKNACSDRENLTLSGGQADWCPKLRRRQPTAADSETTTLHSY